jgi:hypothetical protein
MNQALYAHMNNKRKRKKKGLKNAKEVECSFQEIKTENFPNLEKYTPTQVWKGQRTPVNQLNQVCPKTYNNKALQGKR